MPKPPRTAALLALILLAVAVHHAGARPVDTGASDRIGDSALDALALAPRVRVVVVFSEPRSTREPAALAATRGDLLARLPAGSFELRRTYRTLHAVAGEVTREGLAALLDDPRVLRVDLDASGRIQLEEAVPLAEVDDFQALGFTGAGVTVAILDTGYDTDHPDLADDLVAERCFCGGCCAGGASTGSGAGSAEDPHGHGTHVAGVVTSAGQVAPLGVAPDAGVVAIRVTDANGGFLVSDLLAGLDWLLDERPDVDLVTMSLGIGPYASPCDGADAATLALAEAVDALRDRGTAVFAASGNDASGASMLAPACIASVLSVGAVYDADTGSETYPACSDPTTAADQVTCFSNSDATTDLFAPGASIVSTWLGGGSQTIRGTSPASPFAAGCAALLLHKAPRTSPDYLEARLEASPVTVTDPTNGLSFPRLDCHDAGNPCVGPETVDLDTGSPVLGTQEEVACRTIEAGPYPIGGTGDVTFRAGERIVLRDGFEVADGGSFVAVVNGLLVPAP